MAFDLTVFLTGGDTFIETNRHDCVMEIARAGAMWIAPEHGIHMARVFVSCEAFGAMAGCCLYWWVRWVAVVFRLGF